MSQLNLWLRVSTYAEQVGVKVDTQIAEEAREATRCQPVRDRAQAASRRQEIYPIKTAARIQTQMKRINVTSLTMYMKTTQQQ